MGMRQSWADQAGCGSPRWQNKRWRQDLCAGRFGAPGTLQGWEVGVCDTPKLGSTEPEHISSKTMEGKLSSHQKARGSCDYGRAHPRHTACPPEAPKPPPGPSRPAPAGGSGRCRDGGGSVRPGPGACGREGPGGGGERRGEAPGWVCSRGAARLRHRERLRGSPRGAPGGPGALRVCHAPGVGAGAARFPLRSALLCGGQKGTKSGFLGRPGVVRRRLVSWHEAPMAWRVAVPVLGIALKGEN